VASWSKPSAQSAIKFYPTPHLPAKTISLICLPRLHESLHALACPSKSQAGGRDPAIYVLIKHFLDRFFVTFVHFVPFRAYIRSCLRALVAKNMTLKALH